MQIRDWIPWGRSKQEQQTAPAPAVAKGGGVSTLQRDMNQLFDDFWSRFDRPFRSGLALPGMGGPSTDVAEAEDEVEISVELPGMDAKDIDVSVAGDVLTLRGEKKAEREEKRKGYVLSERTFGSFYRSVPLPPGIDADKASAEFRNGVLTIRFPKPAGAGAAVRKISIDAS